MKITQNESNMPRKKISRYSTVNSRTVPMIFKKYISRQHCQYSIYDLSFSMYRQGWVCNFKNVAPQKQNAILKPRAIAKTQLRFKNIESQLRHNN
jgi:hypothetical protein